MRKLKYRVRDVLLLLISLSGLAWLYRRQAKSKGPLVRVLCFHDVPDREWFAAVIESCAQRCHLVTPEQFHHHDFDSEKINLLITFDDGYQSWVDVAVPVLAEYNAKAIFFITSGLLDAAEEGNEAAATFVRERLKLQRSYQTLTWDGARALIEAGHIIGGHTRTHASLGQLATVAEIEREVLTDKQRLESMLNITITDFAYPFGTPRDIPQASARLSEIGVNHQYSARSAFMSDYQPGTVIPRTLLEEEQSVSSVGRWIDGGYDILKSFNA